MLGSVRFLTFGVGGLLAVALGMQAPSAGAADPITLRMEMFGFAGIHVLTLHTRLDETATNYAITADYATTGVAGLMVDLKAHSQVRGALSATVAQPKSYHSDVMRNGAPRHDFVEYGPHGVTEGGSTPPGDDPIPAAAARNTVDALTAYFMLERQLVRTGSCKLAVPIYDGHRRYDLYFTDAAKTKLTPAAGQNFSGEVVACRMTRYMREASAEAQQEEGARAGTIWYARLLPGDAMVPVRMSLDTQLGNVDAYLADVRGLGVNLRFME
jgi:hypothetical protein